MKGRHIPELSSFPFAPLEPTARNVGETMHFEAFDILTSDLEIERDYVRPEPGTVEEIIAYFAQRILRDIKAPGHFEPMATKLKEFFANHAFGGPVDLTDPRYWTAMGKTPAAERVVATFVQALRPHIVEQRAVTVQARLAASTPPPPSPGRSPSTRRSAPSSTSKAATTNSSTPSRAGWTTRPTDAPSANSPAASASRSSTPMSPATSASTIQTSSRSALTAATGSSKPSARKVFRYRKVIERFQRVLSGLKVAERGASPARPKPPIAPTPLPATRQPVPRPAPAIAH